jgi:proteasome lid subunit RPN8/RPN11
VRTEFQEAWLPKLWQTPTPTLRFTPTAWAKLEFLRDCGNTEIGGFGITSKDDLLLVQDVRLINQICTEVSVEFDDHAVADFFDEQVDGGRKPDEFARVWLHTHPGDSAQPSGVDEETFARCFGRSDWAVMFILAKYGETYARLRFNVGPGGSLEIPVRVDFKQPFAGANHEAWTDEYINNVVDLHALRRGVLDQRWETTDPTCDSLGELLDSLTDFAGGPAQHEHQYERQFELDDIPY